MGSGPGVVQAVDFANGLAQLDIAVGVDDGNPGAIVAPVLKSP
ncbi:uncharacterized protein METZ01_LOCUS6453 [marine metagenome]|uniref:Uncharacterized protein n=1 Tax=marine metagenome TaxID=408172 RepID=A0A381NGS2_9ZZZZ